MPNRVQKFFGLNARERGNLLAALILLPATTLLIRLIGVRRTQAILTPRRFEPSQQTRADQWAEAVDTARMVNIARNQGIHRALCLPHSLVLVYLLRRRGLPCELMIGAQISDQEFAAHAWVELDGIPLNDEGGIENSFRAFSIDWNRTRSWAAKRR